MDCGSGLARDGIDVVIPANRSAGIAGKPAPTGSLLLSTPDVGLLHCGSGLARDGSTQVFQADRVASIAGKPAPTGSLVLSTPDAGPPHIASTLLQGLVFLGHAGRSGAQHFADCIREIRKLSPGVLLETLEPDYRGRMDVALEITAAEPSTGCRARYAGRYWLRS